MIWDIIKRVLERIKFYVEISKFCSLEISVLAIHHPTTSSRKHQASAETCMMSC